jgi:hypothetical protein
MFDAAARGFSNGRRVFPRLALALCLLAVCLPSLPREARAQSTSGKTGVRISQIYTHGGESGASFRHDYVELFNGGPSTVDLFDWSLHISTVNGGVPDFSQSFFSIGHTLLEPGRYVLLKLGGAASANGPPLPAPDFNLAFLDFLNEPLNLKTNGANIALLREGATGPPPSGCPSLPSDGIEDYVGYGSASCREGSATAPAPGLNEALKRAANGCTDTDDNDDDFQLAAPAPRNSNTPAAPCVEITKSIQLSAPQFGGSEAAGRFLVKVTRSGDASQPASVEYLTRGGTASPRSDYTTALGTLRFAPGEIEKTVQVLVTDDIYFEETETVNFDLLNPVGATLGIRASVPIGIADNDAAAAGAPNPADSTVFFVRQHYHDFLNREPDTSGLVFWVQNIERCGTDQQCRTVKRMDTSAAFFLSIEFQQTGYLVHRAYRAAFAPVAERPQGMPGIQEFLRDTQELGRDVVVGRSGWEQALEANTRAFFDEFVTRAEFVALYPDSVPASQYVDSLNANTGGALTQQQRDESVAALDSGDETRAGVLRKVAENRAFSDAERNRAFVLMQYFGYLRRNPHDPPDSDLRGFDFWLQKLDRFGGDFRQAQMIQAFLDSIEYRQRFAP